MFRTLVRPGVELRLLEERHAAEVFAAVDRDRAYLAEWLPWVEATATPDDSLAFIRASLEQFAQNNGFACGIWNGNAFAGVLGTHKINWLNRKVELGYWIGKQHQGKGIVTDSCRAAISHLFDEVDLNRVEIHCAITNVKSCAIPKRLGFVHEGTIRDGQLCGGQYQDLHVFGMLKRDWHA